MIHRQNYCQIHTPLRQTQKSISLQPMVEAVATCFNADKKLAAINYDLSETTVVDEVLLFLHISLNHCEKKREEERYQNHYLYLTVLF